jgi:IS30 family transposase
MVGLYRRLSEAERVAIMVLMRDGRGPREIGRRLGRSASTICRETARWRACVGDVPYAASGAAARADVLRFRRRNPRKLIPGKPLFAFVARKLRCGWSPLQIAGRLRCMHPDDAGKRVSHETIYRALYALPRGALRRELLACLRQGHKTRRPRSQGSSRKDKLPEDLRIAARPDDVEGRLVPGHWEGDLIKGAFNRTAVGTLVERTSRLVLLARLPEFDALTCQKGFERLFREVPEALRKSLTYDRGPEMARHRELAETTGLKIYFADPHCPWQRGSNENANGLIRQYLPKGSDLSHHTQADLNRIAHLLNTRPRKVLDFRTPLEVFEELMGEASKDRAAASAQHPSLGSTAERPSLRPDQLPPKQRAQRASGIATRSGATATRRRRRP